MMSAWCLTRAVASASATMAARDSYSVGVAEKVPLWLKLTAPGTPGHAASPGDNQAVLKLVAALNRLGELSKSGQSDPRGAEVLRR